MAVTPLPPVEFLRECFVYDPETGEFRWRWRPEHHFPDESVAYYWNLRHAGNRTFLTDRKGYLTTEVVYEGRRYRLSAHRVAWKMAFGTDPEILDHVNRVKGDNRIDNLRVATPLQSSWNRRTKDRGLPTGVFRYKGEKKFVASVSQGRRKVRLGRFDTPEEAYAAYAAFCREHRGEFFEPGNPGAASG